MPGQTWQCRVPGQPQTALKSSRTESSVAQPVPFPATGPWGSWLPRGCSHPADTGFWHLFPGPCRLQGVPGSRLCTQTPDLGPA